MKVCELFILGPEWKENQIWVVQKKMFFLTQVFLNSIKNMNLLTAIDCDAEWNVCRASIVVYNLKGLP